MGEILLRFDPADERIRHARTFRVWDGGGEYNVAKNLSRAYGLRTAIATALVENSLGKLADDLAKEGNVDTSLIKWKAEQEGSRNGIYFIERGFGLRVPASCFDRSATAASMIGPGEFGWGSIFGGAGSRWFHTGGIFAGLSDSTFEAAKEAMSAARDNGSIVSYDLNYRHSLWKHRGGIEKANEQNRILLEYADVVFGIPDHRVTFSEYDENAFKEAAEALREEFSNLKLIVTTLREVRSASLHDLSAACFFDGQVHKAKEYRNVAVLDRVGSGDAFASGLIYGLLCGRGIGYALDCATAHACLVMCSPGDNSTASLDEIESLMESGAARVER